MVVNEVGSRALDPFGEGTLQEALLREVVGRVCCMNESTLDERMIECGLRRYANSFLVTRVKSTVMLCCRWCVCVLRLCTHRTLVWVG